MKSTSRLVCLLTLAALAHPATALAVQVGEHTAAGAATSVTSEVSEDLISRLSRPAAMVDRAPDDIGSSSVSASEIRETIPANPEDACFDWYSYSQPLNLSLTHKVDPDTYFIEDHVFAIWLEPGEDAAFIIDGPDDPAVDLDLYVYPPGSDDFSDDHWVDGNETPDEGIVIYDVLEEGYWFVRVNSYAGTGAQDTYGLYWGFESPDDDIPGVPLSGSILNTRLDEYSDSDDVVSLWLTAGETVDLRLDYPIRADWTLSLEPELHLYGPGSTSIWDDAPVASSTIGDSYLHRSIQYTVPVTGLYYVDMYQPHMPTTIYHHDIVTLTCTRSAPVHRFYNWRLGTHFYTASDDERERVQATLSDIYAYEGIAYRLNPAANSVPLHRFYRPSTGTHFYTADPAEKNRVQATLSSIYTYEGPAYNVSADSGGISRPTVYRFYNRHNGTHFYTADRGERDRVISTLGTIYNYDGPAFWLGQ